MSGALLGNRSFRALWLAGFCWGLGAQAGRIGLLLWLASRTSTPVPLAWLVVAETLPGALAAPVLGALVDRLPRRGLMVSLAVLQLGCVALLLVVSSLGGLLAVVSVRSMIYAGLQTARASGIAVAVPRERLLDANGLDQSATNVVLVASPVIGAQAFLLGGLPLVLLLDSLAAAAGACCIAAGLTISRAAPSAVATRLRSDIVAGWQYLWRQRTPLLMTLLLFTALTCTAIWSPLAPFIIRDQFGAPPSLLGWHLSLFGAGAIAGGLVAAPLARRLGSGTLLFAALVTEAASLGLYAASRSPVVAGAVIGIWGIGVSLIVVPFQSILQQAVDPRFLGRTLATVRMSEHSATAIGMLLVMATSSALSPPATLAVAALLYLVVTLACLSTRSGRTVLAT